MVWKTNFDELDLGGRGGAILDETKSYANAEVHATGASVPPTARAEPPGPPPPQATRPLPSPSRAPPQSRPMPIEGTVPASAGQACSSTAAWQEARKWTAREAF